MILDNYYNTKITPFYYVYFGDGLLFDKNYISGISINEVATYYATVQFGLTGTGSILVNFIDNFLTKFANDNFVVLTLFVGNQIVDLQQTQSQLNTNKKVIQKMKIKGCFYTLLMVDFTVNVRGTGFYDINFSDMLTIAPQQPVEYLIDIVENNKETLNAEIEEKNNIFVLKVPKDAHNYDKYYTEMFNWIFNKKIYPTLVSNYENARKLVKYGKIKELFDTLLSSETSVFNSNIIYVNRFLLEEKDTKNNKYYVINDANNKIKQNILTSSFSLSDTSYLLEEENATKQNVSDNTKVHKYILNLFNDSKIKQLFEYQPELFFVIFRSFYELLTSKEFFSYISNVIYKILKEMFSDVSDFKNFTASNLLDIITNKAVNSFCLLPLVSQEIAPKLYKAILTLYLSLLAFAKYSVNVLSNTEIAPEELVRRFIVYVVSVYFTYSCFEVYVGDIKKAENNTTQKINFDVYWNNSYLNVSNFVDIVSKDNNLASLLVNLGVIDVQQAAKQEYRKEFFVFFPKVLSSLQDTFEKIYNFFDKFLQIKVYLPNLDKHKNHKKYLVFDMNQGIIALKDVKDISIENLIHQIVSNMRVVVNISETQQKQYSFVVNEFTVIPYKVKSQENNDKNNTNDRDFKVENIVETLDVYFKELSQEVRIYINRLFVFSENLANYYKLNITINSNSYDVVEYKMDGDKMKVEVVESGAIDNDNFHKPVGTILVTPPIWALKNYITNGELNKNVFIIEEFSFSSLRPLVYVADITTLVAPSQQNVQITSEENTPIKTESFIDKIKKFVKDIKNSSILDVVPYVPDVIMRKRIKRFWASFSKALYDTFEISITLPYQPTAFFKEDYSIMQPYFFIKVYDKITQDELKYFSRKYYLKGISHSISDTEATTTLSLVGLPPIDENTQK